MFGREVPWPARFGDPTASWVTPVAIYVATRIMAAIFLIQGASRQIAMTETTAAYTVKFPTPANPGYWTVTHNWDGQWYKSIALNGYPMRLPMVGDTVQQNEWAFYPLFPGLVRAIMELSAGRIGFNVAAPLLATLCGGVAMIVLHRMLLETAGRFVAAATVLCVCLYAAAPIMQVAYTESMAMMFITLVLYQLRVRNYAFAAALSVPLSLTRGIAPAMAIAMGLYWLLRWWHRKDRAFERVEQVKLAALTLFVGALSGVWPLIVDMVTGHQNAFLETQRAWKVNADRALFNNWWQRIEVYYGPIAATLIMAAVLPLLIVLFRKATRVWGLELRAWALAYAIYLFLVTSPGSSTVRFVLLILAPLWPFPDPVPHGPEEMAHRRRRIVILVILSGIGIVAQYLFITEVFTLPVPPGSGRPYP